MKFEQRLTEKAFFIKKAQVTLVDSVHKKRGCHIQ